MPGLWQIILLLTFATLGIAVLALLVILLRRQNQAPSSDALQLLQQQIGQTNQQLTESLQNFTTNVNNQLTQSQNLAQQSQKTVVERLAAADKNLGDLKGQLGQLAEATRNIQQVGTDIKKLQDILQSPKLRGNLGEWSLENLLADVLPDSAYQRQHKFKSGATVDALVLLADGSVPIDAKFPLADFQNLLAAQDPTQRQKARTAFLRQVKIHIDTIAEKYILPAEGTLNFALMYIPAENVYYETLFPENQIDIAAYARQKKVIPVSPNSLYVYLMTIATGLKALQIEKNAQHILRQLSQLTGTLELFNTDYATLGSHIKNAHAKHDEAGTKLQNLCLKLQQLQNSSPPSPDK